MRKCLVILLSVVLCSLVACSNSNNDMVSEKPPEAMIKIGDQLYETILGSNCWSGNGKATCIDRAGAKELLQDEEPIKVKAGEEIAFIMDYEPQPNKFHVLQMSENDEIKINVRDNLFSAPYQEGIYYYSYGVWWMDEEKENVSNGDAFYNFVIEVE